MPHRPVLSAAYSTVIRRPRRPRRLPSNSTRKPFPAPPGTAWGARTIHGNPDRGTGILNNELYVGKLVWNRLRYIKDPETGKRVSRPNPESELITQDVPDLRIIADDLWQAVKARQKSLRSTRTGKKSSGYWGPAPSALSLLNRKDATDSPVLIHPNMANYYRDQIA
jgi:hypothetical protein